MTSSAPGPRFRTQASNFSWRRRSAAPEDTNTVSMANWRKHSFSRNLEDSFRSTNAARAATFLAGGVRAGAVPKALSISARLVSSMKVIVACRGDDGKTPKGQADRYKSSITWVGLVGGKRGEAGRPDRKSTRLN